MYRYKGILPRFSWLFQIPPFPNRRILRVDSMEAWAGVVVIVDDAAGLQMGIYRHRAHVLKAVTLQLPGDLVGQAVADGDFSFFVSYIQDGFAPGMSPQPIAEAAVLLPDFLKAPGVVDYRLDLPAGTNHAVIIQDALHVGFGVSGDFVIIEAVKAGAKNFPLLEHQAPGKAALHGFHHQMLKHHPVIVYRHAPFGIVVGFHGFKGEAPIAGTHRVFSPFSKSQLGHDPVCRYAGVGHIQPGDLLCQRLKATAFSEKGMCVFCTLLLAVIHAKKAIKFQPNLLFVASEVVAKNATTESFLSI